MTTIFLTGLIGSLILVLGAAWPIEKKIKHPTQSIKNWLFAIGGLTMFIYALLGYLEGGNMFYVILELMVIIATFMMMLDYSDRIDTIVISISAIALIAWSLTLFEDYSTILFILGLAGIALGYALEGGTVKRNLALTVGSILIAVFSYLGASWIFFWLNTFFAIFSGYYVIKLATKK